MTRPFFANIVERGQGDEQVAVEVVVGEVERGGRLFGLELVESLDNRRLSPVGAEVCVQNRVTTQQPGLARRPAEFSAITNLSESRLPKRIARFRKASPSLCLKSLS